MTCRTFQDAICTYTCQGDNEEDRVVWRKMNNTYGNGRLVRGRIFMFNGREYNSDDASSEGEDESSEDEGEHSEGEILWR